MLTVKKINDFLSYVSDTGEFFWKVDRTGGVKAGDRAGSIGQDGYVYIKLLGRRYSAHRLAYLITHGAISGDIDHIDRDRGNNRISNLRVCTKSENQRNRSRCKNGTSGRKGVTWNKSVGRWQAQSKINGKSHYLGVFDSADEAANAYAIFCKEKHGEFYAGEKA